MENRKTGYWIHGSALTDQLPTLRFGMGFMTLNRQLVNLEPKLAEIFSFWDTTAVSLGKTMGKTRRESPWKTSKGRSDTLGFSTSESITLKIHLDFRIKELGDLFFFVYGEISKCAFRRKLQKNWASCALIGFQGHSHHSCDNFLPVSNRHCQQPGHGITSGLPPSIRMHQVHH